MLEAVVVESSRKARRVGGGAVLWLPDGEIKNRRSLQ